MSAASAGVVNAAAPKVNVPARDAQALPVGEAASRPLMHSDEVAEEGSTADIDGAVCSSLAERDSIRPGIVVRVAQEIDCPAGQIESAPTGAAAAAAQAEPAIVYQCPAVDRESADAPAAKFKAAQASNRPAIQRKGAVAASRRAHLEHKIGRAHV